MTCVVGYIQRHKRMIISVEYFILLQLYQLKQTMTCELHETKSVSKRNMSSCSITPESIHGMSVNHDQGDLDVDDATMDGFYLLSLLTVFASYHSKKNLRWYYSGRTLIDYSGNLVDIVTHDPNDFSGSRMVLIKVSFHPLIEYDLYYRAN